jgi:hypothetical protein
MPVHASVTTTWTAEQTIPDGVKRLEWWGIDDADAAAPEERDCWVQITDPTDGGAIYAKKIPAGQTFYIDPRPSQSDNYTYKVRSDAGTCEVIARMEY